MKKLKIADITDFRPLFFFLGVLFAVFSIQKAAADSYTQPLVSFGPLQANSDDFASSVLKNYKGPRLSKENLKSYQPLLSFTLYPDGKIKWLRRVSRNTTGFEQYNDSVYHALSEAVKSAGSKMKIRCYSKPIDCMLIWRQLSKNNGTVEIVVPSYTKFPKYRIETGSKQVSETSLDGTNLKHLIKNLSSGQLMRDLMESALLACFFRINPDGSVDSIAVRPIGNDKKAVSKKTASQIYSAIQSSAPFFYSPNKASPDAPLGRLLIFDRNARDKFRLVEVSEYASEIKVDIRNSR